MLDRLLAYRQQCLPTLLPAPSALAGLPRQLPPQPAAHQRTHPSLGGRRGVCGPSAASINSPTARPSSDSSNISALQPAVITYVSTHTGLKTGRGEEGEPPRVSESLLYLFQTVPKSPCCPATFTATLNTVN